MIKLSSRIAIIAAFAAASLAAQSAQATQSPPPAQPLRDANGNPVSARPVMAPVATPADDDKRDLRGSALRQQNGRRIVWVDGEQCVRRIDGRGYRHYDCHPKSVRLASCRMNNSNSRACRELEREQERRQRLSSRDGRYRDLDDDLDWDWDDDRDYRR